MAHDTRFHEIVLTAAGNRRLASIVGGLRDLVRFRGASTVGHSRDLQSIHAEHVAVIAALRERDAALRPSGCAAISCTRRNCCWPRRAAAARARLGAARGRPWSRLTRPD